MELLDLVLDYLSDQEDAVRRLITLFLNQVMEIELEQQVGASNYEQTDKRVAHRNGKRPLTLKTRYYDLELLKPEIREKAFETVIFDKNLCLRCRYLYKLISKRNCMEKINTYFLVLVIMSLMLAGTCLCVADTADEWKEKGDNLETLGRYDEAIDAYKKAIAIDPDDKASWNNMGNALDDLGRYNEAIEAYDQALKIDPNYTEAKDNRDYVVKKIFQCDCGGWTQEDCKGIICIHPKTGDESDPYGAKISDKCYSKCCSDFQRNYYSAVRVSGNIENGLVCCPGRSCGEDIEFYPTPNPIVTILSNSNDRTPSPTQTISSSGKSCSNGYEFSSSASLSGWKGSTEISGDYFSINKKDEGITSTGCSGPAYFTSFLNMDLDNDMGNYIKTKQELHDEFQKEVESKKNSGYAVSVIPISINEFYGECYETEPKFTHRGGLSGTGGYIWSRCVITANGYLIEKNGRNIKISYQAIGYGCYDGKQDDYIESKTPDQFNEVKSIISSVQLKCRE